MNSISIENDSLMNIQHISLTSIIYYILSFLDTPFAKGNLNVENNERFDKLCKNEIDADGGEILLFSWICSFD